MQEREFTFSVVVPVYKVERYLDEAIGSLVEQTIGFREHVQLVLVNDGSPDASESICLRYRDAYPDNVVYVRQENGGVSSARNAGLRHVRGAYVNFLDGDDAWAPDALALAAGFIDAHPGIEVVAARMRIFDAQTTAHPLNYKFRDGDRVIDIAREPNCPQLHVNSAFIRRDLLEGRSFDTRLSVAEDFRLIAPIIMEAGRYGVLASAVYNYRRRPEKDSAISMSNRSWSWFFDTPRYCHAELIAYSRERFGEVTPYLQYAVMYDLQYRIKPSKHPGIQPDELARYRAMIAELLSAIEDRVVLDQRVIVLEHKVFALALKRGVDLSELRRRMVVEGGRVTLDGVVLRDIAAHQRLVIEFMTLEGEELVIEGLVNTVLDKGDIGLCFEHSGTRAVAEFFHRREKDKHSLGERIHEGVGFRVRVPLATTTRLRPLLRFRDHEFVPGVVWGEFTHLAKELDASYYRDGAYTFLRRGDEVEVRRGFRPLTWAAREAACLRQLAASKRGRRLAVFRVLRMFARPLFGRVRIWMVSDRIMSAGDNGEAFFRYLRSRPTPGVRPYFTISKDSPDYERLRGVGPVVPYDTWRYRLLSLLSSEVVSSAAEHRVISPFGDGSPYVRDLYRFRFVFLQHGVIKDDLSRWLNRYNRNISLFVTSTRPEYRSILEDGYYYDERVVKLVGLPRHDALIEHAGDAGRKIVFMPTWRQNLGGPLDLKTGLRQRLPEFTDSEYFRFYDDLINDRRLLDAMAEAGYTGSFVLHPALVQEAPAFTSNERITVVTSADYQAEFVSSRLMVTDYSSVAFDFAVMRKPVIYAQFDRESFYHGHTYTEGYFDYERDGFGPVCDDHERTLSAIIESVRNDCVMDEEYRARADAFFFRSETTNCEGLYREILAQTGREGA